MTMSPTAVRTARRNLVQRIGRFVRRIQTEGFQPGPDAIANFEVALECLERADYPSGETPCSGVSTASRRVSPGRPSRRLASLSSASSGCGWRSNGAFTVEFR